MIIGIDKCMKEKEDLTMKGACVREINLKLCTNIKKNEKQLTIKETETYI